MQILVDIGNTNVKWATYEQRALGEVQTVRLEPGGTQALSLVWISLPHPQTVRVANVAGDDARRSVIKVTQGLWGLTPFFVQTAEQAYGVTVAYDQPQRLGVDRWLALVAVHSAGMTPAIVLDCGTAVTLDAIDAGGRHLGGLIVPGLRMMWDCVFARTRIPLVTYKEHPEILGTDTNECVAGGAIQAIAGMIERVRHRIQRDRGLQPTVVLTGSDALRCGQQLDIPWCHEPDLVLKGLSVMD